MKPNGVSLFGSPGLFPKEGMRVISPCISLFPENLLLELGVIQLSPGANSLDGKAPGWATLGSPQPPGREGVAVGRIDWVLLIMSAWACPAA